MTSNPHPDFKLKICQLSATMTQFKVSCELVAK